MDALSELVQAAFDDPRPLGLVFAGAAEVDRRSLRTLRPGRWLNDEVINAYLALTQRTSVAGTLLLGTHFYAMLVDHDGGERLARGLSLDGVRQLLVPVHLGDHWVLVHLNVAAGCAVYYDSLGDYRQDVVDVLCQWCSTYVAHPAHGWLTLYGFGPQQTNGADCGVYVLATADRLAHQQSLDFSPNDMRLRIAYAILTATQ